MNQELVDQMALLLLSEMPGSDLGVPGGPLDVIEMDVPGVDAPVRVWQDENSWHVSVLGGNDWHHPPDAVAAARVLIEEFGLEEVPEWRKI